MAGQRKRKLAFLSFDWDYEIVNEFYRGMQAYLEEVSDTQLVIFSAFGHYRAGFTADAGSHKLFMLCNPELYDGFIVQGNRTWAPELRQEFVNMACALGKPVVSINYVLDGAYTVGTNNYEAMYGLIDRVLTDYDIKDPAFVNGLATSIEAQNRARAYRDACAAHGLSDPRFYQASWQVEDGRKLALERLQSGESLPEVIFCCNDDLAIGIQETLQQHGVRVPEDVMITGFDNREIGRCVTPRIATVDRDYATVGKTAVDAVRRLLDGEELSHSVYSPVRYRLRESCGYDLDKEKPTNEVGYSLDYSLKRLYELLDGFQSHMNNTNTVSGILRVTDRYIREARCPNVYITISDSYLLYDSDQDLSSYASVSHLMVHAGSAELPPCDDRHIYATFASEDVLPDFVPQDVPVYMVFPLRYGSTCIGTFVTEGVSPMMSHGFLTFCLTTLAAGINSVRSAELLRLANLRLDNLYVHDELTGLYNRFGLERFGKFTYDHLLRGPGRAHFIFVDIDNMKGINDKFGHEAGNAAIRDAADVIRRATIRENAFSMRYGGDEFLVICKRDISAKLETELSFINSKRDRLYELGLSIGVIEVHASDGYSMDEAIQMADATMYEIKKQRRIRRGV